MGFILKVSIASLLISLVIKFGGPELHLSPNSILALFVVLFPSSAIAIAMLWRTQTYS